MPIATLQKPKGTDYRLMVGPVDFILFRGREPVEVTPHIAGLLRNRPDFIVTDGTLGQAPKGIPTKKPESQVVPVPVTSKLGEQNDAGITHELKQPKFERLLDKVG